jgi:hypothetical protein
LVLRCSVEDAVTGRLGKTCGVVLSVWKPIEPRTSTAFRHGSHRRNSSVKTWQRQPTSRSSQAPASQVDGPGHEVVRVDLEDRWLLDPGGVDGLEGIPHLEGLEVLGEAVGQGVGLAGVEVRVVAGVDGSITPRCSFPCGSSARLGRWSLEGSALVLPTRDGDQPLAEGCRPCRAGPATAPRCSSSAHSGWPAQRSSLAPLGGTRRAPRARTRGGVRAEPRRPPATAQPRPYGSTLHPYLSRPNS